MQYVKMTKEKDTRFRIFIYGKSDYRAIFITCYTAKIHFSESDDDSYIRSYLRPLKLTARSRHT
jgi:hypothetical protein